MKKNRFIYLLILSLFLGSSSLYQVGEGSNLTFNEINSTAFVSQWDTTLISVTSSSSQQVRLPLEWGGTYDFTVDWGDGTNNIITSDNRAEATHTYVSEGVYTIVIEGVLIGWRFSNVGDKLKIIEISQWGNMQLGNSDSYFYGSSNLELTATDVLDLTGTTTLFQAFRDCANLGSIGTMNNWDVSGVRDMDGMFRDASSFNQPMSNWHVSGVRDMDDMFRDASSFDQPIGDWDVSSVTSTNYMFWGATSFNQPIGNWKVSYIVSMASMFGVASSFNQPIGNWDVHSVSDMSRMFWSATSFDQPIDNWDVSGVTNMASMFRSATSFDQPIDNWDVSSITTMASMFREATSFNRPIGKWDVSGVTNMNDMFLDVTLSTTNYDNLLTGWAALSLQTGVIFHGGNSVYSSINSKQYIIDTFDWTIIDGGSAGFETLDDTTTQTLDNNSPDNTITQSQDTFPNSSNFGIIFIVAIAISIGWILLKPKSVKSSIKLDLSYRNHNPNRENTTISIIYCSECSSKLSLSDVFCGECGTKR